MFISNEEKQLGEEFIHNGYVKKEVVEISALDKIKQDLLKIVKSYDEIKIDS